MHYPPDYLYREAQNNETVMKVFKDDIFTSGTILEEWENVSDSELVKELINVGEYETYENTASKLTGSKRAIVEDTFPQYSDTHKVTL